MGSGGGWQGVVQQGIQQQGKSGGGASGGSSDKGSRFKKAAASAGKAVSDWAQIEASNAGKIAGSIQPVRYKKGGRIAKRKPGIRNKAVPIIAHENERVIPADKRKKVERLMKKAGMNLTDKKRGKDKRKKERRPSGR